MNDEILKMQSQLEQDMCFMFREKPVAFDWLTKYLEYVQVVDDCVDEPKDSNSVRDLTKLASLVFNHNYWVQYRANLLLLERITHCTYFDAVIWEQANEEWKRRDARVLTHCGLNMLYAVILIEFGEDKLAEVSLKHREFAHLKNPYEPSK
jgi:hypothetical protein